MKEEKEGVKAAEQEKPKKRRNRKKNRKNEMRKSYFAGMISMLALVMIVLVGTTFLWPGSSADHPGGFWSWRKTAAIKAMISQLYAGDVDDTELSNAMYKGMISGLGDKYSTYYTKEEYEAIKTAQEGYYQGIGVTVTLDGDKLQVTGVQDDTPAAKAGIQADDRIVKIDGQTLEGLNLNDAVGLLKNSENDTVTLSIEREGEADLIETEVKKEKLAAIVADGKMLDDKIGYLAISEFTGLTSEQFQKVYQSLQDQGMERLIIDLRGNPGGLVTAVCDTLRQILPEGLIVYTEDKNGKREEYTCDGDTPISIPLVVLVNENTASAAEIFTGAVKDYGIGTIVGTTTFGKGIVQNTFQLSDGSVVKLTIAHYYTPLGNDIHKVLMVGGSSRIPAVQDMVKKLTGKEGFKGINPDECVAMGAALQGGVLTGDVKGLLLLDVTPLSLGIETMGGVCTKLIDRNTTIPVKKSQIFSTAADNQTSVEVNVLQGEREMAAANKSLGRFHLDGIAPARRGVPQIEVTFDIDANGIVNVSAKDLGTGKEQHITITSSSNMSKDDIEKAVKEAEEYAAQDKKMKEDVEIRNQADQMVYQSEKTLSEMGDKIPADDKTKVQSGIDKLKETLKGTDTAAIKAATDELTQAFYAVSEKLYQQANPQGGAQPGPDMGGQQAGGNAQGGQYYDADYKVVDDDQNNKQ